MLWKVGAAVGLNDQPPKDLVDERIPLQMLPTLRAQTLCFQGLSDHMPCRESLIWAQRGMNRQHNSSTQIAPSSGKSGLRHQELPCTMRPNWHHEMQPVGITIGRRFATVFLDTNRETVGVNRNATQN